mmetsp:Transcript_39012/g.51448  ORF Transcript_39012/g.51448 Transcript_39012/m.51448 type:complete len:506 (+) Transcript_39012:29-1546(+)
MANYSTLDGLGEDSSFLGSSPASGFTNDVHRESKFREWLDWVIDQFRDRPVRSSLITLSIFFFGAGIYTQFMHHSVSSSTTQIPYPNNSPVAKLKDDNQLSKESFTPRSFDLDQLGSTTTHSVSNPKDGSEKPEKKMFSTLNDKQTEELFDAFLKEYPTPETAHMTDKERENLLKTFKRNMETIDELNSNGKGWTTYNLNKFASFSPHELDDLKGYYSFEDDKFIEKLKKYWHDDAPQDFGFDDYYYDYYDMFFEELSGYVQFDGEKFCGSCGRFPDLEKAGMENMPETYDWRQFGAVTEVQDQCHCGAGYAFAVADNVASAWYLARSNHHLEALSPQYLASCDYYTYGCMGGWFAGTFSFIHDMGMFSEELYPFESEAGRASWCKGELVDSNYPSAVITSWTWIPHTSEEELKLHLVKNGPLVVGVSAKNLEFYESGIDEGLNCDFTEIDHAMLLVGWGMNAEGVSYWIVKNSWGKDWGDEGYWYPEIGNNACGIGHHVMTALA